jgi:hypothetical protein
MKNRPTSNAKARLQLGLILLLAALAVGLLKQC